MIHRMIQRSQLRFGALATLLLATRLCFGQVDYFPSYYFSTLAGSAPGSVDGTGAGARFNSPTGLATDSSGNIYVADPPNQTIRKITPDGVVTTLAGAAGVTGTSDGVGAAARFDYPSGIAVDSFSNVFVADRFNNEIREITPDGKVSTFAGKAKFDIVGNPVGGQANGTGAAASFNSPFGLAIDSSNNLYVTDYGSDLIRKITPAAQVTTLAGKANQSGSTDGAATNAEFYQPEGLTIDGAGNLFVADTGNNIVRKIDSHGVVSTIAGLASQPGTSNGMGSAARFFAPTGVALAGDGDLYVSDSANSTIRLLTPNGSNYAVTVFAGATGQRSEMDGTNDSARFTFPQAVAVDSEGILYVADSASTIRKVTPDAVVTTLAGQPSGSGSADGTGPTARFHRPSGVALDTNGNVFVADSDNFTIREITPGGAVTTYAGKAAPSGLIVNGPLSQAEFYDPVGLVVDSSNNIYVADSYVIRKISAAGVVSTLAGGAYGDKDGTGSAAQFAQPVSLAVDTNGNIYVADQTVIAIRKVTPSGVVSTLQGWTNAAALNYPSGVAVDSTGNIYVADTDNSRVQVSTPSGVVTTLAGEAGQSGNVDGIGGAARFNRPSAVAVDASGNVYVADQDNTIRRVTDAGVVTTLAGTANLAGSTDGVGNLVLFNGVLSLAFDAAGDIFAADAVNNIIRKGVPASALFVTLGVAAGVGLTNGMFQFSMTGPPGRTVIVEASADFSSWTPIATNTVSATQLFIDPDSASASKRFYRTVYP
jgi:sugar lactone lactonase YvrE